MRVAVFGAGYAGLTVARQLERRLPADIDLVVVDESTDHLVQHELHRVIRYPSLTDAVTVSLDDVLSRAEIREATVTDIDTADGVAELDDGETLEYDIGAVCLGSETEFYGLDGVEEAAVPLKSVDHARSIREQALDADGGTAVVGGAGLSGIQAAGELAALSEANNLGLEVRLVEMADQVAPGFDDTFADAVRTELDARNVVVETGTRIEQADGETISFEDGRSVAADVFVWTGGIRGPSSLDGRRHETDRDLKVSDQTFVVGDAVSLTDIDETQVPASAQTAVREGRVAATNILELARSDTEDLETYEHQTAGWVVSVGDGAVAKVGPVVFSGEPARTAKAVIGFGHLGSVGAIRQASELVAEELGWPTAHGVGAVEQFEGTPATVLPTDPATPGQYSEPLTTLLAVFGETLPTEDPVDVTSLTRQFDPTAPGTVLNAVQDAVVSPIREVLETDREETESEELVDIDVSTADETDTEIDLSLGSDDESSQETGDDADNESESTEDEATDDDNQTDDQRGSHDDDDGADRQE